MPSLIELPTFNSDFVLRLRSEHYPSLTDDQCGYVEHCVRCWSPVIPSPMEAAFAFCWLVRTAKTEGIHHPVLWPGIWPAANHSIDFAVIPCQCKAYTPASDDFRQWNWPLIAVEIDGHEFHERTQEQVTRRNIKDRWLQRNGWRVFHFSGTEMFANPEECVDEVWDFADADFREWARR